MFTTISTAGQELNLEYVKGITLGPIVCTMSTRDGEPVDMGSARVLAWVQRGLMGEKVVDMEVVKVTPSKFSITLGAQQTMDLPNTPLVWGVAIIWSNGQLDSPLFGNMKAVRLVPL